MPREVVITAGQVTARAELLDNETADAVWDALPIEAPGSTWGDEIYFSIPVHLAPADVQDVVAMGDLGYWPPGSAFCIFFGPTPMSRGEEIRPASAVSVLGRVQGDARAFKDVRSGARVRIERA